MSIKTSLVKNAIKWTPDSLIKWVANSQLKGIAEVTEFSFDLDSRKTYLKLFLNGEEQPIEVNLDGFAVVSDGESHKVILQQAQSNKLWLNNMLLLIVGKEWKIPALPQFQSYVNILAEVFNSENIDSAEKLD